MLVEIISGIGIGTIIGAVLSVVLQYALSEQAKRKTVAFQEKKEAFIGLLDSYRNCAKNSSSEAFQKDFAYWHIRCQLVSNDNINNAIEALKISNVKSNTRELAENELINAMQKELKQYI